MSSTKTQMLLLPFPYNQPSFKSNSSFVSQM